MKFTAKTTIKPYTESALSQAVDFLQQGYVVGMPTETVYGLGADATNPNAIAEIYTLKNRPQFNPLISHVNSFEMIEHIAEMPNIVRDTVEHFFPSALTLVLKRSVHCPVSRLACAGLDSIAVRMPKHLIAQKLISQLGKPICAPSANRSGHISPTCAEHVKNSLPHGIPMILDGGQCETGIESTILDMSADQPVLLRAGSITKSELENFFNRPIDEKTFAKGNNPIAPGQLKSHYAPDIPLYMNQANPPLEKDIAYIGFGEFGGFGENQNCHINLSESADLNEAAARLFDALYTLSENKTYKAIFVAPVPNYGIGIAINDKLVRASSPL